MIRKKLSGLKFEQIKILFNVSICEPFIYTYYFWIFFSP